MAARGRREALPFALAGTGGLLAVLRGEVAFLPAGALANDGKVIDDVRVYR